ncbi:MAG TPA: hypothetical protein GX702_07680 [Chloroflexi bacterium]|jgi:hypothetical protein|nr:hypothetical protein [Chloroflexota bacterium]
MKRWLLFILAVALYAVIHEGAHALVALSYGEYEAFYVRPYGLEVIFRTPVEERGGVQWALISGVGNLATLAIGYLLLASSGRLARLGPTSRVLAYYVTLLFLLLDAFNLSIGPFLYGGDANGIAVGLGVSRYLVQGVFLLVLLVNRELVAQRLLPAYGVQTTHPLFRPWIRRGKA